MRCQCIAAANFLKDFHLARQSLHLLVGHAARVGETASGLPVRQWCAGKDIKLDEFVSAGSHNLKGMAVSGCGIEPVRIERKGSYCKK